MQSRHSSCKHPTRRVRRLVSLLPTPHTPRLSHQGRQKRSRHKPPHNQTANHNPFLLGDTQTHCLPGTGKTAKIQSRLWGRCAVGVGALDARRWRRNQPPAGPTACFCQAFRLRQEWHEGQGPPGSHSRSNARATLPSCLAPWDWLTCSFPHCRTCRRS